MAQTTVTDASADVAPEVPEHEVLLTEAAAAKVAGLLIQEGRDDLRLRVAVQPGGCSGLVYQLYFDERLLDAGARVGVLCFREFLNAQLAALEARGLTIYDLETDVNAFTSALPRVRIIPLTEFDPAKFI